MPVTGASRKTPGVFWDKGGAFYNVKHPDFGAAGAVGNGVAIDTAALQAALDAANSAGGGTVWVPDGTYLASGLSIGSNTLLLLSPGATIKLDPSIAVGTISVLLSNKLIYPGAGNTNIHIRGGAFDGSYTGGTASPSSTFVILLSLCTYSSVDTRIINGRRDGLTLEFCKYTTIKPGTIADTCAVNNLYFSGSDHCTIADGVMSRKGGGSGSGAGLALSASWFTAVGAVQLTEPQAGAFGLILSNDTEHFEFTGGIIEGLNTVNTQLAAAPYYGGLAGNDHFNPPTYNGAVWHSAAKGQFSGTLFRGMKGRNASAVNWTRGSDIKFPGCRFVGAWANGLATFGTKRVCVRGATFEDCGDIAMGDGVTAVPAAGRYAVSFDYLDATYDGSGCELANVELVDTKAAPTMQGVVLGPSATPAACVLRDIKARNLSGNPLTLTTNVPVTVERCDWGMAYSADAGDANYAFTLTSQDTIHYATALTANRTVSIPATTTLVAGWRRRVVRRGLGAFTLDVAGVKTIPASTAAFVDIEYDGTAIKLVGYGPL
jgi:hypothetical protein